MGIMDNKFFVKKYLDSQKNRITRFYAKHQIDFVNRHPSWFVGRDVIDVGCGCGVLEALWTEDSKSFNSCDIMDSNFYGIRVKICSAEDLKFDDNTTDSIFMLGVIEHIEKPQLAIQECYRTLRSGGKLILSIPNGFCWWLMKLVRWCFPSHLKMHIDFGQRQLYKLLSGWKLNGRHPIVRGLFWLYEFEKI